MDTAPRSHSACMICSSSLVNLGVAIEHLLSLYAILLRKNALDNLSRQFFGSASLNRAGGDGTLYQMVFGLSRAALAFAASGTPCVAAGLQIKRREVYPPVCSALAHLENRK